MPIPIPIDTLHALLSQELGNYVWPFFRIAGVLMVAPVFGARVVPVRVRVTLSLAVTFILVPVLPSSPAIEPSLHNGLFLVQEVLLGIAMGLTLQMVLDALVIAGQTIAMTMGLGFAMLVDPQRGVSVPDAADLATVPVCRQCQYAGRARVPRSSQWKEAPPLFGGHIPRALRGRDESRATSRCLGPDPPEQER